ncbi:MAG: hypothetical protein EAZ47_10730 [Bacteroidetes bacterium]|nr:MAG: hypothetical protein EAY72_07080 [Bacteroidota bacterium]TAE72767.1 MAG: hypothetical protein EAY68_00375 [Bacteroidota bacterium]TAF90803.1 MAG: hypothetical protein EAZ47_10730 [Bacteroidota bacterium]
MSEQNIVSPLQSLQIIEEMIQKAKANFADNGFVYLLWGYTIFTCSMLHFIGIKLGDALGSIKPYWVWNLVIVANIIHTVYQLKRTKKQQAKSFAEELIAMFWLCFLAGMIIISVAAFTKFGWASVYPFLIMLYGTPTFLSGYVMKFKPLIFGGIFCWLMALVALFFDNAFLLLCVSLAVLVAWIIPGHLLQQQYSKKAV